MTFPLCFRNHFISASGGGGGGDPWDANVALLLHFNGTDASTTFTDSSIYAQSPATVGGDAQIDTSQSVFGTGSGLFDGTGDYIQYAAEAWAYSEDRPWTLDLRVRFNSTTGDQTLCGVWRAVTGSRSWHLTKSSGGNLQFIWSSDGSAGAAATLLDYAWAPASDTWYALRLERSGSNMNLYIDGARVAQASLGGSTVALRTPSTATGLLIGALNTASPSQFFNGWVDELRVVVDRDVTSGGSSYTVPASAFSDPVGTASDPTFSLVSLLCLFEGSDGATTTADSSSYGHAVTLTDAELDTSIPVHGSSSLEITGSGATSAARISDHASFIKGLRLFTIDIEVRTPATINTTKGLLGQWEGSGNQVAYRLYFTDDGTRTLRFDFDSNGVDSTGQVLISNTLAVDTIYKIRVCRDARGYMRMFLNGVLEDSDTSEALLSVFDSSDELQIGNYGSATAVPFDGRVGVCRIVVGQCLSAKDDSFTHPSAYPVS